MLLFSRTLEPEEWEAWRGFLESQPSSAVEWAFDSWQRNGRFFPKPKDILELVAMYEDAKRPATFVRYEHHGQGYGEGDFLALWKMVSAESLRVGHKLTQGEIWQLLEDVDAQRPAGAPDFRRVRAD
jgi:hypothetical protein